MLTPNDRDDLRWAMQAALLEQTSVLHENRETVKDYVLQEATYEQLLNLCFNPYSSNDVYMEAQDLEWVAKDVIYEMTGAYGYSNYDLDTTAGKFNLLESLVIEADAAQIAKMNKAAEDRRLAYVHKKKADIASGKRKAPGMSGLAKVDKRIADKQTMDAGRKAQADAARTTKQKAAGVLDKAKGAVKGMSGKQKAAAAAGGAALAAGAYYVYRKARKAGKDKKQAAQAAASAAQTPEEKAKWAAKARG
jgi:hypothetical protein